MDVIATIIKDIIDIKYECNNIQNDATIENMLEWYSYAVQNRLVIVIYKYGQLQGFIEWIRLSVVPETRDEAVDFVNFDNRGRVLYIANCCVRDDGTRHGAIWKLIHLVREQNPDFEYVCWHDMNGKLKLYSNTKLKGDIYDKKSN